MVETGISSRCLYCQHWNQEGKKKNSWERKTEPWLSSPALRCPPPSWLPPWEAAAQGAHCSRTGQQDTPPRDARTRLTCPAAGTQPFGAQPPCQTRRGSHTGVRAVTLCSSLMPSLGVPKPSNFLASTTGTAFCWATLSFHNADAPSRDVCHHTTPVFHRGCKLPASRTAPAPAAPMLSASDRAVAGLRLETISGGDTCLGSGVRSRSHGVCAF